VPLVVHPGDGITVSITQQGTGNWLISLQNVTTGQNFQVTQRYASSLSSAEWVVEAPSSGRNRLLPLDDFGTIAFTNASAMQNGQSVSIAEAEGKPITLLSSTGQALAEPSSLGPDGASFSVTRTTAPAVSPQRAPAR
jgi:peptidase A4-like protein